MSYGDTGNVGTYALVAEFLSAEDLLAAAERVSEEGYRAIDAYTPFPVHGLSDALRFHCVKVPYFIICAGLCGAFFGFTLQWYTATIDYPLNVGGKPFNSLPSFFPVTFESTILFSAITALISVFALSGLPRPYHSIFNTPGFKRASKDRFFLAIETKDPKFELISTREFLASLGPVAVSEVEA